MSLNQKLSVADFRKHLNAQKSSQLQDVIILQEVGSSNDFLFTLEAPKRGQAIVCMAEHQTAGRGTKGRTWHSRFGASMLYSIAWCSTQTAQDLSALSLAVGVVAQAVLQQMGYEGIKLKWPNDLLFQEAKLGGILVEARQTDKGLHIVCGIGINVLSALETSEIDQAFISLDQVDPSRPCSRNELGARLTTELLTLFNDYPVTGFAHWKGAWESLHAYQDKPIRLMHFGEALSGTARGVDDSGALLLQTKDGIKKIISA